MRPLTAIGRDGWDSQMVPLCHSAPGIGVNDPEWVYFTEDGSAEPEVWKEQSKQHLPQTAGMLQEVLGW